MIIIGINAYHGDSSACLVQNGILIAAAEEERFRRVKHWAGFPSESIRYCLEAAGVNLCDVAHVAINRDTNANLSTKIGFTLAKRPDLEWLLDRFKHQRTRASVTDEMARTLSMQYNGATHAVEHHRAHLSSAFHVSSFDQAVVVSMDGFGDFASAAWGMGRDTEIAIDAKIFFPHSLGIFYQAMSQWLGFPNYGDEYKVMGLAPYGQPHYMAQMRQLVDLQSDGGFKLNLNFFRHHREKVEFEWENGDPRVGTLFADALVDLLGPVRQSGEQLTQRHKDLAHSTQAMYEEALFHLLNVLHQRHRSDNLCLAGGCAMNSVANGKVYRNTPFKRLYIQSAAGDAGGAIGAAYAVWHKLGGKRGFVMDHAYWGPQFSDVFVKGLLETNAGSLRDQNCSVNHIKDETDLFQLTANAISEGKVVGWFQGRMEWGPRALGNRSILGDPRRSDMKDILNLKIKRRESFRPFAPSVLRESVSEWFEQDDDVPFMMQVYPIRHEKQSVIPAVTHADGSGRLQTVTAETNPRYHALIRAFCAITGVPILLNTSFNENEPVVCTPAEALDCFLRTKMDLLVVGNWVVKRG